MATRLGTDDTNILEQFERIRRMSAESDKLHEERLKLAAEQTRLATEQLKIAQETSLMPRYLMAQTMLATAALLGAGAAIAKLFFP
jgi:hypothetical protein